MEDGSINELSPTANYNNSHSTELSSEEINLFSLFKNELDEFSRVIGQYTESKYHNQRLRDPKVNDFQGPTINSTFDILYNLEYFSYQFRKSTHPLSSQANSVIYQLMDIIFSGARRYDQTPDVELIDSIKLIDDYYEIMSPTHLAGVSDGTFSYDFELDLDKFKANWLEAYRVCIPDLIKISYNMLTCCESSKTTGLCDIQSEEDISLDLSDYMTVTKAAEFVHKSQGVKVPELTTKIKGQLIKAIKRAAQNGEIQYIKKPNTKRKSYIFLISSIEKWMPQYLHDRFVKRKRNGKL